MSATTTTNAPQLTAGRLTHLQRLEAEAIQIMREAVSESERPAMLYSIGKDSSVMLHLAMKAFHPSKPPFPLVHVDTTFKFSDMYAFRDNAAKELGLDLIVHQNPECLEKGINPFDHGSAMHTDMWKTEGLKQVIDANKFDLCFGGARRDEEKSRAKERIFSIRSAQHQWDPKRQRPELWQVYNAGAATVRRCGCSRSRTGPSSTCGSTCTSSRSRSCRSTTRRRVRWSIETAR
jgi:sulfate adenylyltransferase subunit 2